MPSDTNPESFVDKNTKARGTFKTEGRVCVDGVLEGKVIAQDRVRITKDGKMLGEIQTREALIEGNVSGPMEASERVILTESSNIQSDVTSPSLNVQPGARLKGYFIITSNEKEREQLKQKQHQVNSKTIKKITLSVPFPEAKKVALVGDFCEWNEDKSLTMKSSGNGKWTADIQLIPGKYEYLFLVDGQPQPDPENPDKTPNSYGGDNSILTVI